VSWGALDDGFYDHPKTKSATRKNPASIGLFARAVSYCSKHETDGRIPSEVMEEWFFWDRALLASMLDVLVEVGFLEGDGLDYRVHDYLDYNLSHEKIEEKREAARERMARLRAEKRGKKDS
jgi:hypothetical protein